MTPVILSARPFFPSFFSSFFLGVIFGLKQQSLEYQDSYKTGSEDCNY